MAGRRRWAMLIIIAITSGSQAQAPFEPQWRGAQPARQAENQPKPVRTFSKPTATSRPATATPIDVAAVIHSSLRRPETDAETLEREIALVCSRLTREFKTEIDAEGRIVLVVRLKSRDDWTALVSQIWRLPELGSHSVVVRGIVN